MKTPSTPMTLVWDLPLRLFHWLLALCFAGAYLSAESETLRPVHVTLGYTMAGLLAFRIVWGFVGPRHARFSDFVRGPGAALRHLRSLLGGRAEHHAGHNPAGAIAILGLLVLTALVTASGWATLQGAEWLEEVHEALASAMLALVGLHVAAVLLSARLLHEPLVGAMIHGKKPVAPEEGIRGPRRAMAVVLLAAVLGFWTWQWRVETHQPVSGAVSELSRHAMENARDR